ncbi:DoxX family protein [Flavobacterium frigidarium]|jgi:thiosulfate dehydrogenase [quinone] large subunit|uniref:DoxX family protein n=1 Tax=Flavobacterium frigidarium TaxID=99286 RepID=UPI00047EF6BF|nr:DoxX family protein [Flavobacterium frigidarium]
MQSKTTYLIVRLGIGLSMFGHGLVRLPKLEAFSNGMVKMFANSILPEFLTVPFTYAIPIVEFTFGLMIVLGLFTRTAAIVLSALLISLIFGCTLIENWDAITSQLVHLAFVAYLVNYVKDNSYAVDTLMGKSN